MLTVVNGALVVEEKGIYSVEKFLLARRFMYWQVYLHKTGVVAEQLLIRILKRARQLLEKGIPVPCNHALHYFLKHRIDKGSLDAAALDLFSKLDDTDVVSALKNWQDHTDFVLSELCKMVINRKLLHIKVKKAPIAKERFHSKFEEVRKKYQLTTEETHYFVFQGKISNRAYNNEKQNINIVKKNGNIKDVAKLSDNLVLNALSKTVTKFYICYPKEAV